MHFNVARFLLVVHDDPAFFTKNFAIRFLFDGTELLEERQPLLRVFFNNSRKKPVPKHDPFLNFIKNIRFFRR